jgi:dihydroflavonol-4-reductase
VRALHRPHSQLRELPDVEPVAGDLRDPASLERAVSGCQAVFHVAADYRLWARRPQDLLESNVDGTRHLLTAARRAGVERVVYTSTVGCIGMRNGLIADESSPVSLDDMTGVYKRSKFLAEQVALQFAADGAPLVIVNPTAPIGDHDFKPTPTGRIVVDFLSGNLPAYLDTGLNVADAADVAYGHWLAFEKGQVGQRYILGSENLTLAQILTELARISGRPAPRFRIPYGVAYAAGWLSTRWADVTGQEPRAPLDGVKMAAKKMWVSHGKAERELGYRPGPARTALEKAVRWFQEQDYC